MKPLFRFSTLLVALGLSAACATVSQAQVAQLDPTDAADTITIMRKLQCSTIDNEPAIYWWHGKAYSRKQGERDVHLFDVEGMNIRACSSISDEKAGEGFHLVSREILLYKDKETGEVLSTWDNPWTGETVDVLQVANDPVNFKMYETNRDGTPIQWTGEMGGGSWWLRSTFPLWYPNPLGGDYQKEVGGTYHATEMFDFFGRTDDLLDPETTTAKITVGWARVSDWLPWMNMNGREGVMYMHTAGRKLGSFEELSETLKTEIATHYPEYASPPPAGDPRPNMTSWGYYKAAKEGRITLPER
ncbi:MAG: DUF1838 family protein [Hyphomonas sp.]|nr:DUF1838 family protein [Hyphomonas sp.]